MRSSRSPPAVGRRGQATAPDHVGAAPFLAVGQVGPGHVVEGDGPHRAAAGWSGAGRARRAGRSAPRCRTGRTSCGRTGPRSRGGRDRRGGACRAGRWAASWAASTRMRPPAAWTCSARSCTGGTTPVTFDAPVTATRAMRPACRRAGGRGRPRRAFRRGGRRRGRPGRLPPRQVVGVVLEHGRQHDRPRLDGQRGGQRVHGLGGVLGEDHRVALGIGAHEGAHRGLAPARRRRC